MGVYGLLSECLSRRDECVEIVDLVEVACQKNGIEILVDFYCFQQMIISNFWKSLSSLAQNDYLRIIGGEYGSLDVYLSKLIKDLKALDIHLVMFIDGAKGSSKIGTEQKLQTWKFRHRNDMKKLRSIVDVCDGKTDIKDLAESNNVRPVLLEIQVFATLKKCSCEMIQCSAGEADFVIARNLKSRQKAFAVLSNDSDFCMFEECKFIPNQLFDMKNDLGLGQPQLPSQPIRLQCGLLSSEKVTSMFGLKDTGHLIEVSIISGNDFTSPHFQGQLKYKLGVKGRGTVTDWVAWVKQHGQVENHPAVLQEMQSNPDFRESIHRSRQFYTLKLPLDGVDNKGPMTSYLDEEIQRLRLPANLMSMHHNFYWHRMLVEECKPGHPCVEVALQQLRSFIYRMILRPEEKHVVEYGRTTYEEFNSVVVNATQQRRWLQPANFVDKNKIFLNLRTFSWVMNHFESRDFQMKYFDRYGRKNGFSCYVLRYFLRLNHSHNLHIDLEEFLAVLAAVFIMPTAEMEWYQHLAIPPTTRSVTIGNWLQDIYRHAYSFLGDILSISHEFPLPSEFISGSVFTAVYAIRIHEGNLLSQGFPPDWAQRIYHESNATLHDKRHMTKHIVDGILDYNPRF